MNRESKRGFMSKFGPVEVEAVGGLAKSMLADFNLKEEEIAKYLDIFGIDLTKQLSHEEVIKVLNGDENEDALFSTYYEKIKSDLRRNKKELKYSYKFDTKNKGFFAFFLLRQAIYGLASFTMKGIMDYYDKNLKEEYESMTSEEAIEKYNSEYRNGFSVTYNHYIHGSGHMLRYVRSIDNDIINKDLFAEYSMKKKMIHNINDCYDKDKLKTFVSEVLPISTSIIKENIGGDFDKLKEEGFINLLTKSFNRGVINEWKEIGRIEQVILSTIFYIFTEDLEDKVIMDIFKSPVIQEELFLFLNFGAYPDNPKHTVSTAKKLHGDRYPSLFDNEGFQNICRDREFTISIDSLVNSYYMDAQKAGGELKSVDMSILTYNKYALDKLVEEMKGKKKAEFNKFLEGKDFNAKLLAEISNNIFCRVLSNLQVLKASEGCEFSDKRVALTTVLDTVLLHSYLSSSDKFACISNKDFATALSVAPEILRFMEDNDILAESIFLILSLFIAVTKEYSTYATTTSTRESAFSVQTANDFNSVIDSKNKEIAELKAKLEKIESAHKKEVDSLNSNFEEKVQAISTDNARLERENLKLQQSLEDMSAELVEVKESKQSLEESIDILMQQSSLTEPEEDFQAMVDYLRTKNLVMVGGIVPVINRMQQYLPDLKVIVKASPSNNYNPLRNSDLNIMYFASNSHGLTYGIKSSMDYDERFLMVNELVNTNELIKRSYKALKDLEMNSYSEQ